MTRTLTLSTVFRRGPLPFLGCSPTAAARGEHPEHIAGPQLNRALIRQPLRPGVVPGLKQPVLPRCSWASSGKAPRPAHPSLGDQAHRAVLEDLQVPLDALAPRGQSDA